MKKKRKTEIKIAEKSLKGIFSKRKKDINLITAIVIVCFILFLFALINLKEKDTKESLTGKAIEHIEGYDYEISFIDESLGSADFLINGSSLTLDLQESSYNFIDSNGLKIALKNITSVEGESKAIVLIGISKTIQNGSSKEIILGGTTHNISITDITDNSAKVSISSSSKVLNEQTSPYTLEKIGDLNFVLTNAEISSKNASLIIFYEKEFSLSSCSPNWTLSTGNCTPGEIKTNFYIDFNNCRTQSGKPENITETCDYNNNGVIGDAKSINVTGMNLGIKIGNTSLGIGNYSGTKTIEIKDSNQILIEFEWDFAQKLDLTDIEIEKQSSNSSMGYIIINGLEVSKEVRVDKLSNSNGVCVKDAEISDISEISEDCSDDDEYFIECPGAKSKYSCEITGGKFVVSGLLNSAVKEMTTSTQNISSEDCIPSWDCGEFGECIQGKKVRLCVDSNNCETEEEKPSEEESCADPNCQSIWKCTDWAPEECEAGETQTRTCEDSNRCGRSLTAETPLSRECKKSFKINLKVIIPIGLILLILAIIIGFILHILNKEAEEKEGQNVNPTANNFPKIPPTFPDSNFSLPNNNTPLFKPTPIITNRSLSLY